MVFRKNKIKICHVASADITIKFLLMPQLKFLIGQGYDVCVVCSEGKWTENIKSEGIKVKTVKITRKITPFSDLVSLLKLFLYFRKERFDIVHTHTPKPGLLGQLAAKMAGVPMVINTIHGLYFTDKTAFLKRNFYIFVEKIAGWCSDLIFSQNKEDITTIIREKIASPSKIKYLGNGVDLKKFDAARFSAEFINRKKQELKIGAEFKIIGAVGRLVQEKGYSELFAAFKKILEKFPETLLLIIGPEEPEKKDAFKPEVIKKYGIENSVMFLGERTDANELYSLMDIFILASHREGFPRTILEAMAMAKPIIATDIRGCREAVDDGRNGILIPPKNSEKLSEAIIFMLDNPDKSKEMGEAGRKKAEKEFDERIIFDRIKEEYQKLIDKKL